jgi:hypothetical protein
MKLSTGRHTGSVLLSNGYFEYEVTNEMKVFWESLSVRERETVLNIAWKQNRDLRDVLLEQM